MSPESLKRVLESVATGERSVADALKDLKGFPGEDTAHGVVDHQRFARCGFPEVIFGAGKTMEQIEGLADCLVAAGAPLLVTRLPEGAGDRLAQAYPDGTWVREARLFTRPGAEPLPPAGPVAVLAAGTSDRPVAEEAYWTAAALGAPVERAYDVGVAGLHRLLSRAELLRSATVLVLAAGMERALPSVVAGLTDRPVIAVPTSVGYGASFGGLAALLAMLNSCASGVSVVNIDNGFSAGFSAALIARQAVGNVA